MNNEYEPYKHPRWNNTTPPVVIGHREIPYEEQFEARVNSYNRLINSKVHKEEIKAEARKRLEKLLETGILD